MTPIVSLKCSGEPHPDRTEAMTCSWQQKKPRLRYRPPREVQEPVISGHLLTGAQWLTVQSRVSLLTSDTVKPTHPHLYPPSYQPPPYTPSLQDRSQATAAVTSQRRCRDGPAVRPSDCTADWHLVRPHPTLTYPSNPLSNH